MEIKISEVFKIFKTRKKLPSCEITVKTFKIIWKQWFYMWNWFLLYLKKNISWVLKYLFWLRFTNSFEDHSHYDFLSLIFLSDIQFLSNFPVRILNTPFDSLEILRTDQLKLFIFLNTLHSTWQCGNPSYFWVLLVRPENQSGLRQF